MPKVSSTQEPNPPMKGVFTSEFWLTVLGVIALVILIVVNKVDGTWGAAAIAFACFGYAGSRAGVKIAQVGGDSKVSAFKTDLALLAQAKSEEEDAAKAKKKVKPAED